MTGNGQDKPEPQLVTHDAGNRNRIKRLLDQLGGETGVLGPLVKALNRLLEDPILKQTIEDAPQQHHTEH